MIETEKLSEFENLRLKYEEVVLEKIKTFISTNNEYGIINGNTIDHIKPRFSYRILSDMVQKYANEGYVDCDKIDEIIAPAMIDDYRIYDNVLLDICRGDESRSDGMDNVFQIIWLLSKVDYSKFPRLKEGLINYVLTDDSQPKCNSSFSREPWQKTRKFNIESLKKHFVGYSFIPQDLCAEIFGEPVVKLTRKPIREEGGLPFD